MASAATATPITNEERRWVVIGVCLTKVLTPALRSVLATEILKWHQALCPPPIGIDKQVYGGHQKKIHPSTLHLNYKNINNNHAHKSPHAFDYTVKDPLSLAKLFVQPFMSKFTGFDQTMDMSAVLSVICEAAPFIRAAAHAKTVRSDIRNEWAHCNFSNWTEAKFIAAFQSMEILLKNVNLLPKEEQKLCDELKSWKDKGFQLCFGQPVDTEILTLLRGKLDELCDAVQTWILEKEQMTKLLSNINKIQSNMNKEIHDLRMRVEKVEIQGSTHSKEIELLDKKITTELSRYVKEEEKIPYVFSAPQRNRNFAGRTEEMEELKRILKVEDTFNEKNVRIAAVCGLGGIGKTSLVTEYAHQMKDFYKGGVYWFSAEDDTRLDKTVNGIAIKIGALLGSFDLNLPNILKKISTTHDPCLIVLDCLDQLHLSSNMMEFLSFPSHENILGHFLVLTRRNPTRLVNEVSIFEEDSCLQLKCFQIQEAKQFLFSRTGVTRDENVESVAECLCEELGRLPLALEQAGGYISQIRVRDRECKISMYLAKYKVERLRLLNRKQARAADKDLPTDHERLAVHTTWLINMEYIKRSPDGQAAVRFMNACSFFDGNEIEEELINVGTPEVEDVAFRKCVLSPLGCHEILKLLTDFSLFTYVQAHSVSTHRLVQELIRESLNPESKAESFLDAVRMLSYAFSKCPSPSNHASFEEQNVLFSASASPSHFYMWSKCCMHGHHLCRNTEDLLVTLDPVCLDSVWFPEIAKIFYECAVHLSANHNQEKAKRTLNFGYRIIDWLPLTDYSNIDFLFPLPIPLPKPFQMGIKQCCMPPFVSLEPLTEKGASQHSDLGLEQKMEKLRSDGNKSFKEGRYKEALDAYSSAMDLAQDCNTSFNPLLLTNRAKIYIKLEQYEDALKDADDYTTRRPDCWMGYAWKALALNGLNEKVSAEIAASLAFYRNRDIFSIFLPFKESFLDLQKRILICDSVDEFREAIFSQEVETDVFNILVLGSEEYTLSSETICKPWNNCILVGTRTDCSVSLKSNFSIRLLKCMLANLSFYFVKGLLHCLPGSFVKILNCNFTSYDGNVAAAVATEGEFNANQCNFTNINASGLCTERGNAVVVDCLFCKNGAFGLQVCDGGTLIVKSSGMYNNGQHGLIIGPKASKCVAINCYVHHNVELGIGILNSKNVTLKRNNVFDNYDHGIYIMNSEADIRENKSFDNGLWGIWSENNSLCNISMNRVFRNKAGGYRGKEASQTVIELNEIYDNIGPGFVETVDEFEVERSPNTKSASSLQSVKCHDNKVYNNRENENVGMLNFSVPYCSHCRKECQPKWCANCFTAAYCNKSCEDKHWSKHKEICKVLREKSSYLITSMEKADYGGTKPVEGPKEIGPMFSPRPPRDGRRFVVKVHTALKTGINSFTDILYDRSLELCETFDSREIDELLEEFGVQCERKCVEKKLFFYCLFEDNGQPRLFTNEFLNFKIGESGYSNILRAEIFITKVRDPS